MDATENAKILAYCKAHGSITVREAVIFCGINSPRKAISNMERKGYVIERVPQDNGKNKPYMRYYIREAEDGTKDH